MTVRIVIDLLAVTSLAMVSRPTALAHRGTNLLIIYV